MKEIEKRELKISYTKSGAGNVSSRITLPIKWIREMGLSQEFPAVLVSFDGEKIIIETNEDANEKYYYITIAASNSNERINDGYDNAFFKNVSKSSVRKEFDSIDFEYVKNWLNADFDNAVVEMWQHSEDLIDPIAQKFFEKR